MRAFIFPGQGSQAVGMGAALAEASQRRARGVPGSRRGARPESVAADARRAGRGADPDRERPAGDHGERHRGAARAREGRRIWIATRPISSPGTASANTPRCARRARSLSPTRRGCSSCAARRCRRRCRWAGARWRRCSAPTSTMAEALAEAAAQGEVCTVANDNDPSQVVISGHQGRDRARGRAGQGEGREAGDPAAGLGAVPLPADAARRRRDGRGAGRSGDGAAGACRSTPTSPPRRSTIPRTIRELLVEQVTGRVRWRESVLAMAAAGVARFVEFGGKVLRPDGQAHRPGRDVDQ